MKPTGPRKCENSEKNNPTYLITFIDSFLGLGIGIFEAGNFGASIGISVKLNFGKVIVGLRECRLNGSKCGHGYQKIILKIYYFEPIP